MKGFTIYRLGDQDAPNKFSSPPTHGGSQWNLASIGPAVFEKIFENGKWTDKGQTDEQRTDDGACLYYKLTNEPKGSGELKKDVFFLKFNQVIYSSSHISWPSFKPLAKIVLRNIADKFKMPKVSKGHNSGKRRWILKKFIQVIYSSSPISWPSFKPLPQILFEISCWQDFMLIFHIGITSEREITRTREKIRVSYFSMRNPYMKFQNPSIHGS